MAILKNLLIIFGSVLIGLGIGMIISQNFQLGETNYLLAIIGSLVLGGFLIALGITKKVTKEETQEEAEPRE